MGKKVDYELRMGKPPEVMVTDTDGVRWLVSITLGIQEVTQEPEVGPDGAPKFNMTFALSLISRKAPEEA